MAPLKLSKILTRHHTRPTLRERYAALKAHVGRRDEATPAAADDVSSDLLGLVEEHRRLAQALLREPPEDDVAFDAAGAAVHTAERAVLDYRPRNLAELHHKTIYLNPEQACSPETREREIVGTLVADLLHLPHEVEAVDVPLLSLRGAFEAASSSALAADRTLASACREADARAPAYPEAARMRETDGAFGLGVDPATQPGDVFSPTDIVRMMEYRFVREVWREARPGEQAWDRRHNRLPELLPWPEAQTRADEIVALHHAWHAERRRIDDDLGITAAMSETDDTWSATMRLADAIAALPATTADGLRLKLRALACFEPSTKPDAPGGRLTLSLLRDAGVTPYDPDEA